MRRARSITATTLKRASGIGMVCWLVLPVAIHAGDEPTAAEIVDAVSDRTYQGSMTKNAFVEYYGPDGSIKGKNYAGKWRVENNSMCFQYGDKAENCWEVEIRDTAMTMIKDGKVDGNGMLIKGNPHNF